MGIPCQALKMGVLRMNNLLNICLRFALRKEKRNEQFLHWSFIIQRGQIVEWGTNRVGNPPMSLGYKKWQQRHAETEAIRRARGILDRNQPWEIVNIRINRLGEVRNSKPCECCERALQIVGCSRVWFTSEKGFQKVDIQ